MRGSLGSRRPRSQALFPLSQPSLCLGSIRGSLLPGGDGGQLPGESAARRLLLIRALTNASLTGLPTPGSEGEFDTNLKIAAVLFLCWRGGAGRGAPATLNDLPTKNKAFSLHLLCFRSAQASSALRGRACMVGLLAEAWALIRTARAPGWPAAAPATQ